MHISTVCIIPTNVSNLGTCVFCYVRSIFACICLYKCALHMDFHAERQRRILQRFTVDLEEGILLESPAALVSESLGPHL